MTVAHIVQNMESVKRDFTKNHVLAHQLKSAKKSLLAENVFAMKPLESFIATTMERHLLMCRIDQMITLVDSELP